jgi:hypothetical protein
VKACTHSARADIDRDVLRPALGHTLFRVEVVVTVGKTQSTLIENGEDTAGILEVLLGSEAEESIHADRVEMRNQHGEISLIPWGCAITEDTPERVSARLWVRAVRTPFYLEKTMTMESGRAVPIIDENAAHVVLALQRAHLLGELARARLSGVSIPLSDLLHSGSHPARVARPGCQ